MELFFGVILFIVGLCCGSFVNMLEYRTAVNYELISPPLKKLRKGPKRSYCDVCGKQLTWYENIPVFSFVWLRGRTRCCNKKLSLAYPFVELGLGVLFVLWFLILNKIYLGDYFKFEYYLDLLAGLVLITFLWFSAVFDLKFMILPDFSTLIMGICALVLARNNIVESLIVGVSCFLLVFAMHKIKIRGSEAMGGGDVKYALVMGILLGLQKTILSLYIAFIIGAIIGLVLIGFKKLNRRAMIAFGPFLIFGTLVSWWFGEGIINFALKFL